MSAHNDPAYPLISESPAGHATAFRGLTKRELFAAMAMQALISKTPAVLVLEGSMDMPNQTAGGAVNYADALIAELEKSP